MAINVGEVEAYGIMTERLQREAGKKARNGVSRWLKSHQNWEAADLRAAAAEIVSEIVADYGGATASLACDLYDSCMVNEGVRVDSAEPWVGSQSAQVLKAVRYQLSKALDGDIEGFLDAIDEMAQYYVRLAANNTTIQNVERDNTSRIPGGMSSKQMNERMGRLDLPTSHETRRHESRRRSHASERRIGDVAYARVPTGLETCTYCMMLASRGFVYRSFESAGHADHRGCNCVIVPGRYMQSTIDGIDIDAQYDCWRELEALEAYAKKNPDEIDASELERRKQEIVDGYGGITLSTEPGEVRKHLSGGASMWYEPRERMAANYTGTGRDALVREAREAARNQAEALGVTEEEALSRFDALVDSNTDAQLRKYIKRYGK